MKKGIILGLVICGMAFLSSCGKDTLTSYPQYSAVNFMKDTVSYSFVVDQNTSDSYLMKIPIHLMGDSRSKDRPVKVKVIHDSSTTAEPSDYKILGGVIKAGEFGGWVKLKLFKSDKIDNKTISLHLGIKNTKYWHPGVEESQNVVIKWTNDVIVPFDHWYLFGYAFCDQPSTSAYRLIIQLTGLTKLSFGGPQYISIGGLTGLITLGYKFGNYVKQYDLEHPNHPLRHSDGPAAGQVIEPNFYNHVKYN